MAFFEMDTIDDDNEEKDVELVTLITEVLQKNGLLNHVKAQIRAGVFAVMEKEDLETRPQLGAKIKQLMLSREGRVCFTVVHEFLKFLNLEFTLSVFEPEVNCGSDLNPLENREMPDFFSFPEDKSKPMLCSMIERLVTCQNSNKLQTDDKNIKIEPTDGIQKVHDNEESASEESLTFSSNSLEKKIDNSMLTTKTSIWNPTNNDRKVPTDVKASKLFPNSLASLSDLPPLNSIKPNLVSLKDACGMDEDFFEPFRDTRAKLSPSKRDNSEEADPSQTGNDTEDILKDLSIEGSVEFEDDITKESTVSQSSGKSNDFIQSV